jgi:hypothetical protein
MTDFAKISQGIRPSIGAQEKLRLRGEKEGCTKRAPPCDAKREIDVRMIELNCVQENDGVTTQNVEMWSGMGEGANQKSRTTRILMELTM